MQLAAGFRWLCCFDIYWRVDSMCMETEYSMASSMTSSKPASPVMRCMSMVTEVCEELAVACAHSVQGVHSSHLSPPHFAPINHSS
jgi:hypothetical protein